MENSFLKDAINRIVELATPFTLETRDGRQFCSANLREVRPEVELPERYSVDTLEALVKLIRTEGINHSPLLYVRVDSARRELEQAAQFAFDELHGPGSFAEVFGEEI